MVYEGATEQKSLAQVLYEASPTIGWTGAWQNLQADQIAWWEAYADLAREHLLTEPRTLNVANQPQLRP